MNQALKTKFPVPNKRHQANNDIFRFSLFKSSVTTLFLLFIFSSIFAQQIPITSHSYVNNFVYNPAQIGNKEYARGFMHTRKQWVGIQGAPETYLFSVDGPVSGKKVGLGLMLFNDETDIIGRTGGYGAYKYSFKLAKNHRIALGLGAGFLQNRIAFDKIRADEPGESTLLANREKRTAFDANLGLVYRFKNLCVGFASYQLFHNGLYYENSIDFRSLQYKLIRHYIGAISYKQPISRELRLDPRIVMRSVQGMPVQFDVSTYLNWNDQAWLGLTYEHHYGVNVAIGGLLYDKFIAGYSYSMSTGNIANYTDGSHEVVLGFRLFSGSGKGTSGRVKNKDFKKLKNMEQEHYEKIEKLEQQNDELKEKIKSTEENVKEQEQEMKKLKRIFERDEAGIKKAIEKYKVNLDELDKIDFTKEDKDLDKKDFYVVLGAYYKLEDAKFFQRILEREAGLKTSVTQRGDGKYFFVYTESYNRLPEAVDDIKREVRHIDRLDIDQYINGNIWVYYAKD
jgi:type IX secretion system PorP/SprF family membrane protein